MSPGPMPGMVNDWFTWWFVLGVVVSVAVVWLTLYILTPKRQLAVVAPVPVSPCAPRGHSYVAQPVVWRCAHCGDERVAERVYDQNAA